VPDLDYGIVLRIVAISIACVIATVVFAACSSSGPPDPLALGKKIYDKNCATCHGPVGQGGIGPKIGGGRVVERYPNAVDQTLVVRNGRNAMPAWGNILTGDQIADVVQYEREQLGR
jgi:mono/diheme cytochrome c family protein